ncbi:MAG: hypothetical protein [Circular genetic element sp.]|nr:MAG: hypothetical protein [Circular genetic element sp.]
MSRSYLLIRLCSNSEATSLALRQLELPMAISSSLGMSDSMVALVGPPLGVSLPCLCLHQAKRTSIPQSRQTMSYPPCHTQNCKHKSPT